MAVTATFVRNAATESTKATTEFVTASLTGTYATGGFTSNLLAIVAGPGSSPYPGATIRAVQWLSPTGYIYVSTTAYTGRAALTTTKIFSAPGTELANGTAVPDATVPIIVMKGKI